MVANCSYEARRFGVRSAMPISEAVRRLPADTVYLRLDMSRYADVSRQIMRVVRHPRPGRRAVCDRRGVPECLRVGADGRSARGRRPAHQGGHTRGSRADCLGGIGPNV
nr:hypothetical protein [Thiocapsa roseopersicina]